MKPQLTLMIMNPLKVSLVVSVIFVSSVLDVSLQAAEPKADATKTSQAKQKEFTTPKEAADTLVKAAETYDVAALTEILGPDAKDLISSEDPVMDKEIATSFVARAKEKSALDADANNKNHVVLTVGNDDFALPIPIVNRKGKWVFDTKAGREEMLNRRIGSNELDAIAICRGVEMARPGGPLRWRFRWRCSAQRSRRLLACGYTPPLSPRRRLISSKTRTRRSSMPNIQK